MTEEWRIYYTEKELAEIQRIELELLDVLSEVCKKLDIKFFLYGGSLLGAVKYGGFVPWDDDFDIAMMRNDYEKLIKEAPALIPEGYELQEPRLNKRTPYPYTKLRKTDTVMVEYKCRNIKINHGVYFDIYPIDNLPDDDNELLQNQQKLQKLVLILQQRQTASLSAPINGKRDIIRQIYYFVKFLLARLFPHASLVNKMNSIMTKYNKINSKRQGNYFFPEPVNYFDGIYPPIEVDFEGRKMLIPQGYKINLKNRYGDIAQDPPEGKKVGHKPYILKLNLEEE
ncbi:MAG: LicD family protein [Clostridia bacterium]|nr:LicD family protein [Clostridia bacterium]